MLHLTKTTAIQRGWAGLCWANLRQVGQETREFLRRCSAQQIHKLLAATADDRKCPEDTRGEAKVISKIGLKCRLCGPSRVSNCDIVPELPPVTTMVLSLRSCPPMTSSAVTRLGRKSFNSRDIFCDIAAVALLFSAFRYNGLNPRYSCCC